MEWNSVTSSLTSTTHDEGPLGKNRTAPLTNEKEIYQYSETAH